METIGSFNLAPVPHRKLPLLVKIRLLFGGMLNQGGWFALALGLTLALMFVPRADLTGLYFLFGDVRTAQGTVTQSTPAGGSEDDIPIYAINYSFQSDDGRQWNGVSYATGWQPPQGFAVTVEYIADKPEINRIEHTRRKPFGPFGLIAVIFPVLGACCISAGMLKGRKAIRLLSSGRLAGGVLIRRDVVSDDSDGNVTHKMVFEFQAEDTKTYQVRTHTQDAKSLTQARPAPVIYDPAKPSSALLLDDLPGRPRIDADGRISCGNPLFSLLSLIIPLTAVIWSIYRCLRSIASQ